MTPGKRIARTIYSGFRSDELSPCATQTTGDQRLFDNDAAYFPRVAEPVTHGVRSRVKYHAVVPSSAFADGSIIRWRRRPKYLSQAASPTQSFPPKYVGRFVNNVDSPTRMMLGRLASAKTKKHNRSYVPSGTKNSRRRYGEASSKPPVYRAPSG